MMNNNKLPIKYERGFFSKFKAKFKEILSKIKPKATDSENIIKEEKTKKNNALEELKVDTEFNYNNEYEKKQFMDRLTEHPELLENFSNERLKKILQWYLEDNEKKREMLKKMNL